ncbi:MAG: hypothetical protein GXP59_07130 [Deltaproteobacteria bacterium]|nr:hypothetical protein [Deltaproteobacteria bacterium]
MKYDKKKTMIYNLMFLAACGGLFLFLWNAPPETTKKLPQDATHIRFQNMGKKAAEKFCEKCHNPKGVVPLPAKHPPKYRCLLCHKQVRK